MATLLDVAQAAGVSKMTVSNALRGKSNVGAATRQRILRIAEEIGYQTNLAARALSSGRNGILELIVQDMDTPFYGRLAKEISRASASRGMQLLVRQTLYSAASEKSALQLNNSLFCDALILATPKIRADEALQLAQSRPLMLIDDCSRTPPVSTVNTPNFEGAYQAVSHLLRQGARNIILLGAQPQSLTMHRTDSVNGLRISGADRAMRDAGLHLTAEQCIPLDWTLDDARKSMHSPAFSRLSCDAIFAMSDTVAMGAVRGLADRGLRVPDDVKVIGFDGATVSPIATPSLSTIEIDMASMARTIIDRLMAMLGDVAGDPPATRPDSARSTEPTVDVAPFTLRARESTQAR